MKILQNPIAVTVLAVAAVGYTGWTIFGARGFRSGSSSAATTTAAGTAAPVPPAPSPVALPVAATLPPPPAAPVTSDIDINAILAQAPSWIESPKRDPFRIDRPAAPRPQGPPASDLLVLSAVWRQTGSQLAIVNELILREGDKVQGYAIETIEADAVWVRGTNGRERVTFKMLPPPQVSEAADTAAASPAEPPKEAAPIPVEDVAHGLFEPAHETVTATLPIAPP